MLSTMEEDKFDYKFYHKMPRSSIIYEFADQVPERVMNHLHQTRGVVSPETAITVPSATFTPVITPGSVLPITPNLATTETPVISETTSLSAHANNHNTNVVLDMSYPDTPDLLSRARNAAHLLFVKYIGNPSSEF